MQGDEVEFEFTPSLLETPSLMTPNIVLNAPSIKSVFQMTRTNISIPSDIISTSNPSLIITTTTRETQPSIFSADVKVSKIEDELKQSVAESRRPTPSPFQNISSNNVFILDKTPVITNDDGTTIEIPSTADVVKELEALTNVNPLQFQEKVLINDNHERDTTTTTMNGDNIHYDSPPTISMGIVSPKKKFLIRSQSHTEPMSPIQNNNNNNLSQSQKSNNDNSILNTQSSLDDENSIDDPINNQFTRTTGLSTITHPSDTNIDNNQQFKSIIDNGFEHHLNIQLKTEQNIIPHPIIKQQQPIVLNSINNSHKRTFQSTNIGNNIPPLTKTNTVIMPQPSLNEVTSTDQLSTAKRQRTTPIPINTTVMNFRSSFPSSAAVAAPGTNTLTTTTTTNGSNANGGSEDQRKKQIRDSNREAARRCRERRRQYIEQLEGTLEQHKTQIKQLSEKLARVERENTQLRAILSETKLLHQAPRMSANEGHVDYTNVVTATGMNINSESNHQIDGRTIQRSYIDRNNL
ncbi:unnamed protein product [Rotaria sordida]|uniref:BZIP domain-containing protein n=1 Tax=Rotaria sordida TaxID=392033 RepID=A0A814USH4_9BILA|nr:unnamed protein product [Rotaria sordida]